MQNKKEKFPRAGYRIHFDRLRDIRAETATIRTHKFKCKVPSEAEEDLKKKFEEVSRVVDSGEKHSVLWFLVQLYGLGFLFVSSGAKKSELISRINVKPSEEIRRLLEKIPVRSRLDIKDPSALMTFLKTTPREVVPKIKESGYLPSTLLENLGRIFSEEKISIKNIDNNPTIKKIHDHLVKFAIERNDLREKDIQDFFAEYWKTTPLLEKKEKSSEEKLWDNLTFVIQPLPIEKIRINTENDIDIFNAYFQYLLPASRKTGIAVQSLMGVSENQNGISNLLGITLKTFQKGSEESKKLILGSNTQYFSENPKALEVLSLAVHKRAQKIPLAEKNDFLSENWSQYRNLLGGRLEGWISNFQNRLELFEKSLESNGKHEKVFQTINENCDWKNIFPTRQQINFQELQKLRTEVYNQLNNQEVETNGSSKNLGDLLLQYNQYLKDFREFLTKWNNEGIPTEIMDEDGNIHSLQFDSSDKPYSLFAKELCETTTKSKKQNLDENNETDLKEGRSHIWKKSLIPNELEQYPRFIGEAAKNPEEVIQKAYDSVVNYAFAGSNLVQSLREVNHDRTDSEYEKNWNDGKHWYRKTLESLKKIAYGARNPEPIWKFFETEVLTHEGVASDIWASKEEENKKAFVKFYLSGYERRKYSELPIKPLNSDQFLKLFEEHFLKTKQDFSTFFALQEKEIKPENGELLKLHWSLLLKGLGKKVMLPPMQKAFEPLVNTPMGELLFTNGKLKNGNIDLTTIQRFIQSSVGSEIRAKLSLLSRREFIHRSVLQITNGEQSFLQFIPLEWGDFSHLAVIKVRGKRKKFTERKLKIIQGQAAKGFSAQSKEVLQKFDISTNGNNYSITENIWKTLPKQKLHDQRKLARVLGEMPHRWAMVLKTKHPIQGMQAIEQGFFLQKSTNKDLFNLADKKRNDHLYSFPIETSNVQKQFLERFLWGDRDQLEASELTETIMGSSVIIEETKSVKRTTDGVQITTKPNSFSLYWAVPFQFKKHGIKVPKEESYRSDDRNILGIDLGEYGFGWAVFDPKTESFLASGFVEIPLLKKTRDEAKNWKETQSRGIFSRPTTYLAELREQAAGQIRNQIHRLALDHKAKPIYEDSVDGFESGGQRISKLYKTLKTSDVSSNSNEADKLIRKHFWGVEYASIGAVIGASKTSQTCRSCGRCATQEVQDYSEKVVLVQDQKVLEDITCNVSNGNYEKNIVIEAIKKAQRVDSENTARGKVDQFVCQICGSVADADEQAAKNIALKYFFKIIASEKEKASFIDPKSKQLSTLRLFLAKSKTPQWRT